MMAADPTGYDPDRLSFPLPVKGHGKGAGAPTSSSS